MTRSQAKERVAYLQDLFGLKNWSIDVEFKRLSPKGKLKGYTVVYATTETDAEYKTATISFEIRRLKKLREDTIVHEFMHILHSPFREPAFNTEKADKNRLSHMEEQICVDFERIILRLLKR